MTTRDITRRRGDGPQLPRQHRPRRRAPRSGSGQLLGSCSPTLAASTRQLATKIFREREQKYYTIIILLIVSENTVKVSRQTVHRYYLVQYRK